jgi:hypothetical protein
MAVWYDAPVPPDALTEFIRNIPQNPSLELLNSFPREDTDDNTIDFAEIVRTNRAAKYRAYDGRIHVSKRDVGETKRVKLLPLGTSVSEGEYERLQREFARTGGTFGAALERAIYNDAENLTREVQNRLELAWGDVLTDGILTVNENGLNNFEADFGVPSTHKVTAATAWTNIAAPALDNLVAWNDVYIDTNGGPAGAIRTSQRVIRLMQTNTQIVDAVHGSTAGKTRVTLSELNDLLSDYNIPPVIAPYDGKIEVDDVLTRVIPDDRLLFTPANLGDLGHTAFGVSATALELVQSNKADLSFEESPGLVGMVIKEGPPFRSFTFVDGVAMPILTNAKRLFIADVAA